MLTKPSRFYLLPNPFATKKLHLCPYFTRNTKMDLHFKEYGAGHPLVILHGLFGMGDNWASMARRLGEQYLTYTPDLRNHGKSGHLPEMDYTSMAGDVKAFMEEQWIYQSFLMGHSMGGKVAMKLALEHPDMVDKLIVVDIGPKTYPSGHDDIFEAMLGLDLSTAKDRKSIQEALNENINDLGIVQFILKNIVYDKALDRYSWRMNLDTIHEHYDKILEGVQTDGTYDKPALFIRGGKSRYIKDRDHEGILQLFPQAKIETIAEAGHWVHADQPEELFNRVVQFLSEDERL